MKRLIQRIQGLLLNIRKDKNMFCILTSIQNICGLLPNIVSVRNIFTQNLYRLLPVMLIALLFVQPVCAKEYTRIEDYTNSVNATDKVYDFANLLTDSQKDAVQSEIERAAENTNLDIGILTVKDNLGYTQSQLADDFYDYGGFGDSGVLLLVDMQEREIYISTAGIAILYLNDAVIETILDDIIDNAFVANYRKLCEEFCEDVVYYTNMTRNTNAYKNILKEWDTGNYRDYHDLYENNREELEKISKYKFNYNPKGIITKDKTNVDFYNIKYKGYQKRSFFTIFRNPLINFVIGAVTALTVVLCMQNRKGNGMTVGKRNYQTENGFSLTVKQDRFIRRSTVSHTIESGGSSSSKGGGSSHHSGSSGRSHGGGGRKF